MRSIFMGCGSGPRRNPRRTSDLGALNSRPRFRRLRAVITPAGQAAATYFVLTSYALEHLALNSSGPADALVRFGRYVDAHAQIIRDAEARRLTAERRHLAKSLREARRASRIAASHDGVMGCNGTTGGFISPSGATAGQQDDRSDNGSPGGSISLGSVEADADHRSLSSVSHVAVGVHRPGHLTKRLRDARRAARDAAALAGCSAGSGAPPGLWAMDHGAPRETAVSGVEYPP